MIRIDLDVPESCYSCPFCDYEEGYCFADRKERNVSEYSNRLLEKKKPDWCPAIEEKALRVKEEIKSIFKRNEGEGNAPVFLPNLTVGGEEFENVFIGRIHYTCPMCGETLSTGKPLEGIKFCFNCGQEVTWNDSH